MAMKLFPSNYSADPGLFTDISGLEIDLRAELDIILNGGGSEPQRGHWVVYRRYDLTQHSEYWNPQTNEGKGGPAYVHTDELWITRRVQLRSGSAIFSAEQQTTPGLLPVPYDVYYFKHTLAPKIQDEIYEITWDDHTTKPDIDNLPKPFVERHNIQLITPLRDINGRIEYYAILTMSDVSKWSA